MAILIFGITFLVAAVIHRVIQSLAVGERARAFKAVSPGLLPPLGIIVGLFVAFLVAQAWGDLDRARSAVNQEASALRAVVILSDAFPGQAGRLRGLVRQHIQDAHQDEWPAMVLSDNRMSSAVALGLFSTAIAICILLVTSHDRPFIGQNGVQPTVLLQVRPDAAVENTAR